MMPRALANGGLPAHVVRMAQRNGRRRTATAVLVTATLLAAACRVPPPAQPVVPADVVVLVADPETNSVGRAVVTGNGSTVNLASDREATRVRAGQAPTTPAVMTDEEIGRAHV